MNKKLIIAISLALVLGIAGFFYFKVKSSHSNESLVADSVSIEAPEDNYTPSPPISENHRYDEEPFVENKVIHYYNGKINNTILIEVNLTELGDSVTGKYKYFSKKEYLYLKGTKIDNEYNLVEINADGNITGRFIGNETENGNIEGNWSDEKKIFPFVFSLKLKPVSTGAVTISSYKTSFEHQGCPCSDFILPRVTKASSKEIQEGLNSNLTVEKLFETEGNVCHCKEERAFGFVSADFEVLNNKGNILSLHEMGRIEGYAHPEEFDLYHNLDLRTGGFLLLKQILTEEGLEYVYTKADKIIAERFQQIYDNPDNQMTSQRGQISLKKQYLNDNKANPGPLFSIYNNNLILQKVLELPYIDRNIDVEKSVLFTFEEIKPFLKEGIKFSND